MQSMTFVQACKAFFGLKPGQSLMEFAQEIRALTSKDKDDLVAMFKTVDIDATKTA